MGDSTIYCHFEEHRFPASDFSTDAKGRRVHNTTPLRTTEGLLVQPGRTHEPPGVGPGESKTTTDG